MVKIIAIDDLEKLIEALKEYEKYLNTEDVAEFISYVAGKMTDIHGELLSSGKEYEVMIRHFLATAELMVFFIILKNQMETEQYDEMLTELDKAMASTIITMKKAGKWEEFMEDVKKRVDELYEEVHKMVHGNDPSYVG